MPTIKKLIATTTSILFTLNRSLMMIYHLNSLLNTFATLLTAPVEATSVPDTADLPTDLPVILSPITAEATALPTAPTIAPAASPATFVRKSLWISPK